MGRAVNKTDKNNFSRIFVFIKFALLIALFAFSSNNIFSQAAQATWVLTSNQTVSTTGNISATNLALSSGLNLIGYNTTYGVQADNFGGGYCTPTYTAYYEFTVTPSACYNLEITSITFTYRCSWDPRCYQLFYSVAGGPNTQIGGDIDIPVRNTDYNYNSGTISIQVNNGETVRFRLYGSGSTASDFGCKNLVVNGTTTLAPNVPLVNIAASPSETICTGTSVTFTPTPTYGGTTPTYEWFLNSTSVSTGSTYVNAGLSDGDQVYCIMTSNDPCASPTTATSNIITMTVLDTPATPGAISGLTSVTKTTTGVVYSISAVTDATNYTWTVPSGWSITGGQGTISITTTSGDIGDNGNITVTAGNMCGVSLPSSLAVSIILPHNSCNSCHINHNAVDGQLTVVYGNANLCISCHNPTGVASSKPFSNSMKAIPGVTGTSHSWDIPSVNTTYETNITTNSDMLQRLPGDSVICSTCHNQHASGIQPNFLRISNTGDNMCKNCHTARDKGTYATDSVNNKGTHPVGVLYDTTDIRLLITPTSPIQVIGNNVECSSCHGIHYFDSGGANGGDGDGYLLRTVNNANLCKDCHTYGDHQGMDCNKCHQPHNTDKTNIYLVRSSVVTPNSGTKIVIFSSETGTNSFADNNSAYDGICEVCHTTTLYHRNDGTGNAHETAVNCTSCHPHMLNFSADCDGCHATVGNYSTDAHTTHIEGLYAYSCSTCHFERGAGTTYHRNSTAEVNFDPNGLATRNGADSNTPTWNSVAKTCTNVYCHSNGVTADRGTDGTYTWGVLPFGTVSYATTPAWDIGTINICSSCHPGAGNMNSPYTITEPGPVTGGNDFPATGGHKTWQQGGYAHVDNDQDFSGTAWSYVNCFWCHETDDVNMSGNAKYQGTYGTSLHVDGTTYFKPVWHNNGGTMTNTLSYSYEGSNAHCANGRTCW